MKKRFVFEVEKGRRTDCRGCKLRNDDECLITDYIDCDKYDLSTLRLIENEEVELIDDSPAGNAKSIDWEQRRFDLVMAAMQAFIPLKLEYGVIARLAIEQADAVIRKYRKTTTENK